MFIRVTESCFASGRRPLESDTEKSASAFSSPEPSQSSADAAGLVLRSGKAAEQFSLDVRDLEFRHECVENIRFNG